MRVVIKNQNNFEAILKQFSKSCQKDGLLTEIKQRQRYEKPSAVRRRKKIERYRNIRRLEKIRGLGRR